MDGPNDVLEELGKGRSFRCTEATRSCPRPELKWTGYGSVHDFLKTIIVLTVAIDFRSKLPDMMPMKKGHSALVLLLTLSTGDVASLSFRSSAKCSFHSLKVRPQCN